MGGGLNGAASRLRAAIEEGNYRPALSLLPEFRREFDAAMAKLPPNGPEALALATEARDLLEWARCLTLCGQAHIAAQLEALACLNAYGRGRRERSSWEISA